MNRNKYGCGMASAAHRVYFLFNGAHFHFGDLLDWTHFIMIR